MADKRLILIVIIQFIVAFILGMFVLTPYLVIVSVTNEGQFSAWQGICFLVVCGLLGLLDVLMYVRRRRQISKGRARRWLFLLIIAITCGLLIGLLMRLPGCF